MALATLLSLGCALAWSASLTPMYASSASILVNQASSAEIFDPATGVTSGTRQTENAARFMRSDLVAKAAMEKLGFEAEVSVATESNADVLRVRAESPEPQIAQQIAQEFALTYISLRRESAVKEYEQTASVVQARIGAIDAQIAAAESDSDRNTLQRQRDQFAQALEDILITAELTTARAEIINPADLPTEPFAPRTGRNMVLAGLLGLMAGVGLALLLETLDISIKSGADLEEVSGHPNLAAVPAMDKKALQAHHGLVTLTATHGSSLESEPYRTLRAALQFVSVDRDVSVMQLTSANAGEGKSTTSANLAVVLARAGHHVLLVDADLRRPRLHHLFELTQEPGLTSVLIGECSLDDAIRPVLNDGGSLSILPSGPIPPGPSELLGSEAASQVFEELRERSTFLIIDCPPILPVSDALVISQHVDATILVANAAVANQHHVEHAMEMLERVDAPVLGTVLNQVSSKRRGILGYGGYGYGYGYAQAPETGSPSFLSRMMPGASEGKEAPARVKRPVMSAPARSRTQSGKSEGEAAASSTGTKAKAGTKNKADQPKKPKTAPKVPAKERAHTRSGQRPELGQPSDAPDKVKRKGKKAAAAQPAAKSNGKGQPRQTSTSRSRTRTPVNSNGSDRRTSNPRADRNGSAPTPERPPPRVAKKSSTFKQMAKDDARDSYQWVEDDIRLL